MLSDATGSQRVLFRPFSHPDGTPHDLRGATLVREYPDGLSLLHVDRPDGPPAVVLARQGEDEGEWHMATPEPAPDGDQWRQHDNTGPASEPEPAPPAEPALAMPRRDVYTCKMCFRRHRGDDWMYCGDTCREAGERKQGEPVGRYGKRY